MEEKDLRRALQSFTAQPLYDACCGMLHCLQIEFSEVTSTPIKFADLYQAPLPHYLQQIYEKITDTYYIGNLDDATLSGAGDSLSIDEVETQTREGRYQGVMVFAVDLRDGQHLTRSENANLTRAFNRIASEQPVVLFVRQGPMLSISTCERLEYKQEWRNSQGQKMGKVCLLRHIDCTQPHRGHLDILMRLGDQKYDTYDALYQHWLKVFSSDELTKDFYAKLQNWYFWAVDNVQFPNDTLDDTDDRKYNNENVIRLITRLMFVWFLMHKGLVNPDLFDKDKLGHILRDFHADGSEGNYYVAILQNLFFATLNQEIPNRRFVVNGQYSPNFHKIKSYYRNQQLFQSNDLDEIMDLFRQTPYVNGGLFECLDYTTDDGHEYCFDGFSNNPTLHGHLNQAVVPNYLFFGEGMEADLSVWYDDKKQSHVPVDGIINILSQYEFTIEENTPLDEDVALDPELLGKVFENLLGAYNPETKTTARKNTGSYYTPRPIVEYMVKESLKAYLKNACPKVSDEDWDLLFSYDEEAVPQDLDEQLCTDIMRALYRCKILDPACGSGAFPMGCLQLMVHVISKLDKDNQYWQNLVTDEALQEASLVKVNSEEEKQKRLKEIHEVFNRKNRYPNYGRKLYIIERCIFGVDIQPIAVQISRLRCFISLLVDQKPNGKAEDNYGILKLPNLESNFVAANTLVPIDLSQEEKDLLNDEKMLPIISELYENRHLLFMPKNNHEKGEYKRRDKELRQKIQQTAQQLYEEKIGEKVKGFQQDIQSLQAKMDQLGDHYDEKTTTEMVTTDLFGNKKVDIMPNGNPKVILKQKLAFARSEIIRLQSKTRLSQTLDKIKRLTDWDMFNQNVSSDFFDPGWMFGVKEGFDVVIANPPYVSSKEMNVNEKNLYKNLYVSASKQFDLFSLFIEKSLDLLKVEGITSFIVPDALIGRDNFSIIRSKLVLDNTVLKWVHLNSVFDSAIVSSLIYVCSKHKSADYTFKYIKAENVKSWQNNKYGTATIETRLVERDKYHKIYFANSNMLELKDKFLNSKTFNDMCFLWRGEEIGKKCDAVSNFNSKDSLPLITGGETHRYGLPIPKKWIKTEQVKKQLTNYHHNKIIIRQLGECINATLDFNGYITTQSVYALYPVAEKDNQYLYALVGVLNSKFFDFFYRLLSGDKQLFKRIILENIKALPYPNLNSEYALSLNQRIKDIYNSLRQKEEIQIDETYINTTVYHLYNLTYDEVLIIEPETSITRTEYNNFKIEAL